MSVAMQAQSSSTRLAQLFHGQQVDKIVNEIYDVIPDSLKQGIKNNLDAKKVEVLNIIAANYSTQFSASEMEQLLLFFSSPLAQKWNNSRGPLEAKNIEVVMEWGMELRENQTSLGN